MFDVVAHELAWIKPSYACTLCMHNLLLRGARPTHHRSMCSQSWSSLAHNFNQNITSSDDPDEHWAAATSPRAAFTDGIRLAVDLQTKLYGISLGSIHGIYWKVPKEKTNRISPSMSMNSIAPAPFSVWKRYKLMTFCHKRLPLHMHARTCWPVHITNRRHCLFPLFTGTGIKYVPSPVVPALERRSHPDQA